MKEHLVIIGLIIMAMILVIPESVYARGSRNWAAQGNEYGMQTITSEEALEIRCGLERLGHKNISFIANKKGTLVQSVVKTFWATHYLVYIIITLDRELIVKNGGAKDIEIIKKVIYK